MKFLTFPGRAGLTTRGAVILIGALGAIVGLAAGEEIEVDQAFAAADTPALVAPPIDSTNCGFANTWRAPRSNGRRHQGVDIIAKTGTPVLAVTDGKISRIRYDRPGSGSGNQLNVRTAGSTTYFMYLHLDRFAPGMALGTPVKAGDVIGYVGKTGAASAPHLHFEIHPHGGEAIDPTAIVAALNTCGRTQPFRASSSSGLTASVESQPAPTQPPTSAADAGSAPPAALPPGATPPPADAASVSSAAPAATAPPTAAPEVAISEPAAAQATASNSPVTVGHPDFGAEVLLTGRVAAFEVISAQVAGIAGIPADASQVVIRVTATSDAGGRAAAWPCGSTPSLEYGTAISVPGGTAESRISVRPGAGGQVCLMADISTSFRVEVVGAG